MAKKKKGISDHVLSKKKSAFKKENPFEVKLNKQKHDVLGKKLTKFDKGAPGLARSKAMKKRKEKLLREFKQKDSANVFLDKRLGENDPILSVEEKMTRRFALEKKRSHEKGSLFNLDEDIELTHYGQSLEDMEKFEAPQLSDDEDFDKGNLDADFVAEELFGGFLKKSDEKNEDKPWKERLQEIISKSKKAKHERQAERDQTAEITEKLDEQWKEIQNLMGGSKKGVKYEEPKRQVDDYDIAVRELKYEMKGTATDRLKSVEEEAKEEMEKLEQLELDRQRRMTGELDEVITHQTHTSADDLNDCYAVDKTFKTVLKYKDGQVCQEENDESEDSEMEVNEGSPQSGDYGGDGEDQEEDVERDSDEQSSDDEGDDNYTDLEDYEEEEPAKITKEPTKTAKELVKLAKKSVRITIEPEAPVRTINLKVRKEMMEAARKELPYTFEIPETVEELICLLKDHAVANQKIIIQRMKQCHHPSLAEGNKDKLQRLFGLLLEYVGRVAEYDPPELEIVDTLTPDLYDLCQTSPLSCGQAMLQVIQSHQENFQQVVSHGRVRGFPTLDVLIHLKLVSVLFSTSDFRHLVVTPSMLFISQLLTQCPVTQMRDSIAGLFLTALLYEYLQSSKRFFPEAINFLRGLLFLGTEKSEKKVESVVPPFKSVGKSVDILQLKKTNYRKENVNNVISVKDTLSSYLKKDSTENDELRLSVMSNCLSLTLHFSRLYEELPSHAEIFQPVIYMLQKLPKHLSIIFKEEIKVVEEHVLSVKCQTRLHLTMQDKKPQAMKMFEPKIETIFDGKKKRSGGDKDYNERQRLLHKHKREMKGAIREIRRDVQFLGREQLNQQIEKDQERKKRVREIHQMLSEQEGDFKALKRKKNSQKS